VISSVQALSQLFADTNLQTDLLRVLAVFSSAGLFISIFFAAQLFLIDKIEQGRLFRRRHGKGQDK